MLRKYPARLAYTVVFFWLFLHHEKKNTSPQIFLVWAYALHIKRTEHVGDHLANRCVRLVGNILNDLRLGTRSVVLNGVMVAVNMLRQVVLAAFLLSFH